MRFKLRLGISGTACGVLLALGSCTTRQLQPYPTDARRAPESAADRQPPRLPAGPLPVLIEAATGSSRLELIATTGAKIVVQRAGDLVIASGGQAGKSVQLSGPLEFRGRTYPGAMTAEPAPEGGLQLINRVSLEDYVAGVVAAELTLWSAQPAELEAQAIAVRTYALRALATRGGSRGGPLVDGVQDQAYRGAFLPGSSAGAQRAAARLKTAVASTRGQVLTEGGLLADVRYHAACGGRTANRASVFPGTQPSPPRPCAPCAQRDAEETLAGGPGVQRPLAWSLELGPQQLTELGDALQLGGPVLSMEASEVDVGERWLHARVTSSARSSEVPAEALRAAIGHSVLKSTQITEVLVSTNSLSIRGRGRGHGVGLCQESSRDYASEGWSAERILRHYYPAMQVTTLSEARP